MTAERLQQLEFCQQCSLRAFSPKQGIVCSLTMEPATFSQTCPDYNEDSRAAENARIAAAQKREDDLHAQTGSLSKYGIKNGYTAGILLIALGMAWIITGLFLGRLFFYAIFLIVFGIIIMVRAGKNPQANTRKPHRDLLDDTL